MAIFYAKSTGGFYDDTIHTAAQIPSDAVEITADQHQALLVGQSSGKIISTDANGNPILTDPPARALADVQASALTTIDAEAEVLRGKFITANSGQVATYMMKQAQAQAYKTAGYTGTVPGLVQSEVDATGTSAQASTDVILAQYDQWQSLAAAIETARRKAKIMVGSATTSDIVASALASATTAFTEIATQAAAA